MTFVGFFKFSFSLLTKFYVLIDRCHICLEVYHLLTNFLSVHQFYVLIDRFYILIDFIFALGSTSFEKSKTFDA
jgi:hypothetical protein